jgi:hypothetical protein
MSVLLHSPLHGLAQFSLPCEKFSECTFSDFFNYISPTASRKLMKRIFIEPRPFGGRGRLPKKGLLNLRDWKDETTLRSFI